MSTKHGIIRKRASSEQNATRPNKTMVAYMHRFATLARFIKVDTVGEYLRTESSKCAERPDSNPIRAVDDMTAGNCGVLFDNQLRFARGVQFEVAALGRDRIGRYPIERTYKSILIKPE
jgi:hypothetical protein